MSSGDKRIIINTRERAVSDDINRAQAFKAQQLAELVRTAISRASTLPAMDGMGGVFDYKASTISTWPHGGDVLNGLFAVADNGSGVTITRGIAGFWVNNWGGGTDDSNYVVVPSDGVSSVATFPFAANGGGSDRWDMLVAYVEDETVLEQASRDLYDSTTGLFTPSLVDKVESATLKFAYVTGTAGNPPPTYPMPGDYGTKTCQPIVLALICVHPWSSGFTTCDFYDTRPLVSARTPPGDFVKYTTAYNRELIWTDRQLRPSFHYDGAFFSQVEGHALGIFGDGVMGGRLRKNVPSSALAQFGVASSKSSYTLAAIGGDSLFIDPDDPDLADSAYPPSSAIHSLSALAFGWPAGYERFVRYVQVGANVAAPTNTIHQPGSRVPVGPNGVLAIVEAEPFTMSRMTQLSGGPPAFNTCSMIYAAAAWLQRDDSGDRLWAPHATNSIARWPRRVNSITGAAQRPVWEGSQQNATVVTGLPASTVSLYWTLRNGTGTIPNGYVPKGARFIRVWIVITTTIASANDLRLERLSTMTSVPDTSANAESIYWEADNGHDFYYTYQNSTSGNISLDARVPVHVTGGFGDQSSAVHYLVARLVAGANINAVTAATMQVTGYEE